MKYKKSHNWVNMCQSCMKIHRKEAGCPSHINVTFLIPSDLSRCYLRRFNLLLTLFLFNQHFFSTFLLRNILMYKRVFNWNNLLIFSQFAHHTTTTMIAHENCTQLSINWFLFRENWKSQSWLLYKYSNLLKAISSDSINFLSTDFFEKFTIACHRS